MANMEAVIERGVTPLEVQYLLERWAPFIIYDAFNLEPPGEKKLILEGVSEHFVVYDQGSRLLLAPSDLVSYDRTLADRLQMVTALAAKVYDLRWKIVDLVGLERDRRAAWVELELLNRQKGHRVDVLNFTPMLPDHRIVNDKLTYQNDRLRPE